MSRSDNGMNVPDLGPAERQQTTNVEVPIASPIQTQTAAPSSARPVIVRSSGPGFVLTTVIILLVAACAALGYLLMGMQQKIDAREQQLISIQQELTAFKESLQLAESSAAESGQSLGSQVTQLKKDVADRVKHVDSEVSKLWTIAYQRNKPQLEAQQKIVDEQQALIEQQSNLISELQKSIASTDKAVTDLVGQLGQVEQEQSNAKKLASNVTDQQQGLKQSVSDLQPKLAALNKQYQQLTTQHAVTDKLIQQLMKGVAGSKSELGTQTAIFSEQLTENSDQIQQLQSSISQLRKSQSDQSEIKKLSDRIRSNESVVRAFDGTRRQLNNELLKLRKRINNLQLKVENKR